MRTWRPSSSERQQTGWMRHSVHFAEAGGCQNGCLTRRDGAMRFLKPSVYRLAGVAELADAADLKSSGRGVRLYRTGPKSAVLKGNLRLALLSSGALCHRVSAGFGVKDGVSESQPIHLSPLCPASRSSPLRALSSVAAYQKAVGVRASAGAHSADGPGELPLGEHAHPRRAEEARFRGE